MQLNGRIPSPEYLLLRLVTGLSRQEEGRTISLERYLENLRLLARPWSMQEALPFAEFVELLCMAFAPVAAYDARHGHTVYTFIAWERRITRQIRDLSEMREAGIPDPGDSQAGVTAPSGSRWYHFDPCSYLKYAVAGAFSGWHESHDTPTALREISWRQFGDFLKAGQGHARHVLSPVTPGVDTHYQCGVVPSF